MSQRKHKNPKIFGEISSQKSIERSSIDRNTQNTSELPSAYQSVNSSAGNTNRSFQNSLGFKQRGLQVKSSLKKNRGTLFDVNEGSGTNDPYGSPMKVYDKNSIMPSLNPKGSLRIPTTVPKQQRRNISSVSDNYDSFSFVNQQSSVNIGSVASLTRAQSKMSRNEADEDLIRDEADMESYEIRQFKPKKIQVSQLTAVMNTEIQDQLSRLTSIQKKTLSSQPYSKLNNQNCSEMIQKVQQDCKAMTYSLRRIVCGEDDAHIQLQVGRETLTDIVQDTLMFFKINVLNKSFPGRLLIQYTSGQQIKAVVDGISRSRSNVKQSIGGRLVDLKIYYSAGASKEPSEQQSQRIYQNPLRSVPLPYSPGHDSYDSPWIYLSMHSESGCQVLLTVQFKDGHDIKLRKKMPDQQVQVIEPNPFAKIPDGRKDSPSQKRAASPFIQRNIEHISNYHPQVQAEISFKQRLNTDARALQVKMNQQQLINDSYKYKNFLLMKWDIIKQKKVQWFEQALQRQKRKMCNKLWSKHIFSKQILIQIYKRFTDVRHQYLLQRRRQSNASRFQRLFKKYLARKTPIELVEARMEKDRYQDQHVEETRVRLICKIRNTIVFVATASSSENQAASLILQFLKAKFEKQMLAQKISSFCLKMNKVAKQIKFRLQSEMMRKSAYGDILSFELNFQINVEQNKQKKTGLKVTEHMQKLMKIDESSLLFGKSLFILSQLMLQIQHSALMLQQEPLGKLSPEQASSAKLRHNMANACFDSLTEALFDDKKLIGELRARALNLKLRSINLKYFGPGIYAQIIKKALVKYSTIIKRLEELTQEEDEKHKKKMHWVKSRN